MPNWCLNSLRVSGSDLSAFRKWLGEDGFKLNKILPLPAELEGTTSPNRDSNSESAKALRQKYGADNWYDWNIQNWGTKWDVDAELEDFGGWLFITFDSAWSPPAGAIIALGKMFPNLTFTLHYHESGCCFAGVLTVEDDVVNDVCHDGGKDKEAYRQFVIDEFDEDPFAWEDEENN